MQIRGREQYVNKKEGYVNYTCHRAAMTPREKGKDKFDNEKSWQLISLLISSPVLPKELHAT